MYLKTNRTTPNRTRPSSRAECISSTPPDPALCTSNLSGSKRNQFSGASGADTMSRACCEENLGLLPPCASDSPGAATSGAVSSSPLTSSSASPAPLASGASGASRSGSGDCIISGGASRITNAPLSARLGDFSPVAITDSLYICLSLVASMLSETNIGSSRAMRKSTVRSFPRVTSTPACTVPRAFITSLERLARRPRVAAGQSSPLMQMEMNFVRWKLPPPTWKRSKPHCTVPSLTCSRRRSMPPCPTPRTVSGAENTLLPRAS
mmetsp:Transcript_19155/g.52174  ORF Transcript_19155/g.52174 Transcript_19155/m.52174 type:complete len:266 (+) Transcript_19155:518-1315(+)